MIGQSAGLLFKIDADSSQAQRELRAIDTSIGNLGSKFSTFAGAATVGAAAIAAVGAAAIAGATALFNFTKQAADFGSNLYDASLKTGLTAEAISALQLAAESSGSSLEAVTKPVGNLSLLLGQAAQGSVKAQETLDKYKITALDTDTALGQFIATVGRMNTVEEKNVALKEVMKDKTRAFIPIIDQVNGKWDEYIARCKELGVVLSEEDLKAADDFGDTLSALGTQAKIAGVKFASELMPMITGAMSSISQFMADNKDVARDWGNAVVDVCRGAMLIFTQTAEGARQMFNAITLGMLSTGQQSSIWAYTFRGAIGLITGGLSEIIWALRQIGILTGGSVVGGALTITDKTLNAPKMPRLGGGGGGKGGGGGGGKSDAEAKAREELQGQIEGQKFVLEQLEKNYKDTMKRIREEFKRSGDSDAFTLAANKANEELSNGANAVLAVLDELERKALKDPTPTKSKNLSNKQQQRADGLNILKAEDFEENGELIKTAVQKILDDLKKMAADNAKDIHDNLVQNAYDEIDTVVSANKEILESEYSTKKQRIDANNAIFAVIKKNAFALNYENNAVRENDVENLNIWRDTKTNEVNKTIQDEEQRKAALEQVNAEYQRRLDLINATFDAEAARIDKVTAIPVTGTPDYNFGLADTWEQFKNSIMQDGPTIGETLSTLGQIGMNAFKGIAEGIGSLIQNWVLLGNTGPNAMKKMVASVLAGVAAQSAVLAVFELAKGFAALFFNPAEAAAHFHAAALFGSIAAVTAVAGRGVAGDSFSQQASGGGSGGGSGGDAAGQPERLNFTETFNGFTQELRTFVGAATDRMNEVAGGVRDQFETFNQKFGTASSTDVVMAGAGGAREAVFDAVTGHMDSDLRASSNFIRSQGKME